MASGYAKFTGPVPTYVSAAGTGAVLSGVADNNGARGTLRFGSGTTPPAAGAQIGEVIFGRSYGAQPRVFTQPRTVTAAQLGALVVAPNADGSGFKVYAPAAIPASQAATTYQYDYWVVG